MDLPRPGLIGILIRLAIAALVGFMAYGAVASRAEFWDGFAEPMRSLGYVVPLALVSSWVVTELVQRNWGWRPTFILLAGLAVSVAAGAASGDAFGPAFGIYLWTWIIGFSILLGPAHLLAAMLRTPGCEMRSYAHLKANVQGNDVATAVCPGWIDRFDGIRLFGRF